MHKPHLSAFLSLAIGGGLITGVPAASAQSVIYACVQSNGNNASVRLVGATEACRPNEGKIQWNVTGQQGPAGPQGQTGEIGPQGPQGEIGATGPQGPAGTNGTNGTNGTDGVDGTDGANGTDGADGAQGPQGYSVAMETVGVNSAECMGDGGVKLTLADGDNNVVGGPQFVCNGAKGAQGVQGVPGPSGTTGQSATTYKTDAAIAPGASCTNLSGFPVNITVPANSDVMLSADGGVVTTAGGTSAAIVDVFFRIDGSTSAGGFFHGFRRVYTLAVGAVGNWSMTRALVLTPGVHTVGLCATLAAGSAAAAGGSANSTTHTALTVTFINK